MKWTNKGHQFDGIAAIFADVRKVYIYGAGQRGQRLCEKLRPLGCMAGFVDADETKQASGVLGYAVTPPFDLGQILAADSILIVALGNLGEAVRVKVKCVGLGFREGINLFDDDMFSRLYLEIFAMYNYDKLYASGFGVGMTSFCSLRCKHCMVKVPYIKNPAHVPFSEIQKKIDDMFAAFDFVEIVTLTGGEALLSPHLGDTVQYLLDVYPGRYLTIRVNSNGYAKIGEALLPVLKHPNVMLEWTYYLDGIEDEKTRQAILENVQAWRAAGLNVHELKYDHWVDYGFARDLGRSSAELEMVFDGCSSVKSCAGIIDGVLYSCVNGVAALRNGAIGVDSEGVSLFSEEDNHRKIMLEYLNGYTSLGYLECCRFCAGDAVSKNPKHLVPGEQL